MAALQKRHSGPDIDGLLVPAFEVVVKSGKQEPFDQRIAIRIGGPITGRRGAQRLGHEALVVRINWKSTTHNKPSTRA
jgi:hypothetical protein